MADLGKVVYLSEAQKETLFTQGSITVDGITITYSDNDLYVTPSTVDTAPTASSNNLVTSGGVYTALEGKATGPSSSVNNHVVIFDGTTGKVLKDSGFTIGKSVPSNAVFTDNNTTYTFTEGSTNGAFSVTPLGGSAQSVPVHNVVTGPASSTAEHVATFNGTTGKVVKDSGFTIGASVPADAVFTDTNTTYTFAEGTTDGAFSVTPLGGSVQSVPVHNVLKTGDISSWAKAASKPSYTKSEVGLGNVDNTSDVNKPISTATQTALNAKAPLASPALTGTPTAPTPTSASGDTQIATKAYVDAVSTSQGTVNNGLSAFLTQLNTLLQQIVYTTNGHNAPQVISASNALIAIINNTDPTPTPSTHSNNILDHDTEALGWTASVGEGKYLKVSSDGVGGLGTNNNCQYLGCYPITGLNLSGATIVSNVRIRTLALTKGALDSSYRASAANTIPIITSSDSGTAAPGAEITLPTFDDEEYTHLSITGMYTSSILKYYNGTEPLYISTKVPYSASDVDEYSDGQED